MKREQINSSQFPYGIVWGIITALPLLSLVIELVFVKRLTQTLQDFAIPLPALTQLILNGFSIIQSNQQFYLVVGILLILFGYLVGEKLRNSQRTEGERILFTLLYFGLVDVLTPIILWILFVIPLFSLRGSF